MSKQINFHWKRYIALRRVPRFASWLIVLPLLLPVPAQQNANQGPQSNNSSTGKNPEIAADEKSAPGEVIIDGHHVLTVYQSVGTYSPQERADLIAKRIVAVAKDPDISPNSVVSTTKDAWVEITAGHNVLMAVTDEDARLAGKPRAQLAAEDTANISKLLMNYQREHSLRSMAWAILCTVFATILLWPAMLILRRSESACRRRLRSWIEAHIDEHQRGNFWQIGIAYVISSTVALTTLVRWLLIIATFELYLTFVLGRFPSTRSTSHTINGYALSSLEALGRSVAQYLPNFFIIILVIVIARQLFRFIGFISHEIRVGKMTIRGFYPEWAEPTARLVRALVVILVVVVAFPYLPGSKSPAFQGISIFVGVLLSLGSTSAVANIISGIILTYMRSFGSGDWVRIGDTVGEVVEKNLLVTRILTPKQEMITIPNATVMGGQVMNYTREAKNAGVIFHTTVTIGYDAEWRTVHQLLINAALETAHVLHDPKPFVLQTALNDFYVTYELNAYTDQPTLMQYIYSELHENIQDRFNDANVEICSPHFSSLRDGNSITIPEPFRMPGYVAPVFRVDGSTSKESQTAGKG